MIHTKVRVSHRMGIQPLVKRKKLFSRKRRGFHVLMEPKQITRPRGMENTSVRTKTLMLSQKPIRSSNVTGRNIDDYLIF